MTGLQFERAIRLDTARRVMRILTKNLSIMHEDGLYDLPHFDDGWCDDLRRLRAQLHLGTPPLSTGDARTARCACPLCNPKSALGLP